MPRGTHPNTRKALAEHAFKPGQSGNPAGRPSAGASIRDWLNIMCEWTAKDLRVIAQDENEPAAKRAAAVRMLLSCEMNDLAAFSPFLEGKKTLAELAEDGVDTSKVKSARVTPGPHGNSYTIELHDRSGSEADRIMDRTEGKPKQAVDIGGGDTPLQIAISFPTIKKAEQVN